MNKADKKQLVREICCANLKAHKAPAAEEPAIEACLRCLDVKQLDDNARYLTAATS